MTGLVYSAGNLLGYGEIFSVSMTGFRVAREIHFCVYVFGRTFPERISCLLEKRLSINVGRPVPWADSPD